MTVEEQLAAALAENATLKQTIVEKDEVIRTKTQDAIGARKKYKLLTELSQEEKERMTPEEIAQKEANDEIVLNQERMAADAAALRAKEVAERKKNAALKAAGNDEALAEKILANYDKLKDSDAAYTDSEVETFIGTAVNMLGDDKPQPIRSAMTGQGGVAPVIGNPDESGYADTPQGQSLAASMGLHSAQEGAAKVTPPAPAPAPAE